MTSRQRFSHKDRECIRAKHRGYWPKPIGNARLGSRPFQSTRQFNRKERR